MKIEKVEYRCDICGGIIENYGYGNHSFHVMVKDHVFQYDSSITEAGIDNVLLDMCDECANRATVINRFRPSNMTAEGYRRISRAELLQESRFEWIEGAE